MRDTNYIIGIIRVLEKPQQFFFKNNKNVVKFRAQFSQKRHKSVIQIICWGKLSERVLSYYKFTSYLMLEGYVTLKTKSSTLTSMDRFPPKMIVITAVKVYPFKST